MDRSPLSRRARISRLLLAAWLAAAVVPGSLPAQTPSEPGWQERCRERLTRHPGEAAAVIWHLESGEKFSHRAQETFPTASLIKLPVMLEAYRQAGAGQLQLTDVVTLRETDKVPGSGILTPHFSPGATFSLHDAIRLMMAWSDNTATNLVIDRIGLPATTRTMQSLGFPETRLNSQVFRRDTSIDVPRSQRYGLGSTTAEEMATLLARLHRGELASAEATADMLDHLASCQDKVLFPRYLPSGVLLRHKTGGVTGVRTDAGLLSGPGGTVVLCVLTEKNRIPAGEREDPGEQLCADLARIACDHFHPADQLKAAAAAAPLAMGAAGPAVQRLQETLNKHLAPAPPIAVDGEFGPQTRDAVLRFQKSRQLAPTGVVDDATRKALGLAAPSP